MGLNVFMGIEGKIYMKITHMGPSALSKVGRWALLVMPLTVKFSSGSVMVDSKIKYLWLQVCDVQPLYADIQADHH